MATETAPRDDVDDARHAGPGGGLEDLTIPMEIAVRIDVDALREIQQEESVVEITADEASELLVDLTEAPPDA